MGQQEADSFLGGSTQQTTGEGVIRTLQGASSQSPDDYARRVKLSKQTGIPADWIPDFKDETAHRAIATDPLVQSLPSDHPKTAEFLSKSDNAALAHDDLPALTGIEKWFNRFQSSMSIGVGMLGFPVASLIDKVRGGDTSKEFLSQQIHELQTEQSQSQIDPNTSFPVRFVAGMADIAPYFLMGPAAPAVIAGSATANKGISLSEENVKGKTLVGLSALSGLTAYGMTKLPFGGKSYVKAAVKGGALNIDAGMAERGLEKGVLNIGGYDAQADKVKILDANSMGTDFGMGVFFGGLSRYHQAKAENNAQHIQDIVDTAKDSKLRQRMTDTFKDFVKDQAKDGEIDSIGMPVEKFEEFYQSTGKPIEELMTDPTAYTEAKVTGGDVVIPIEDFMAHMSEHVTPEHIMDMRLHPGEDTLREAQDSAQTEEKDVQDFLASASKAEKAAGFKAPAQKVYDDLLGQLLGAHVPREVAEKQAAFWAIRQRTRAERQGKDAWELYNERPVQIVRPLPDELAKRVTVDTQIDPLLDKLRAGNIPADSKIYGPSLGEFLREKGVKDAGGELASLDVDGAIKPFKKKMIRAGGLDMDKAREAAVEAGYLPEGATIADFLDAIDNELRGTPKYSDHYQNGKAADEALTLNQLKDYLDQSGIDLKKMNNEDVRKTLSGGLKGDLQQGKGETQAEQLRPAVKIGGKTYVGEEGGDHKQTRELHGHKPGEGEAGFAAADGKFMTRTQAKAWVKKNDPATHEKLPEGEMHSQPYAEAFAGSLKQPDANRGFIRLGEQNIQIGLLEKADLSTFLHETGHAWLEELKRDALREDAPEQIKQDWETAKKEFGITGDGDIPRESHEKAADSFEQYLKEGKAPSAELMPMFQRFKQWVTQAYRKLKGLADVKLTDSVRGVFDRMLATDDEIAKAEDMQNLRPLFATAKEAGMTEAEFAPYKKVAAKAHEENKNRLLTKMLDELNREQKQWWKDAKEEMKGEVTDEARANPIYQAFQFLAKGESWEGVKIEDAVKLSRADLVKMYGEDFVKALPRSFQRLYSKEGGIHPDLAAEMFGFGSGDELVRQLAEAPKMEKWISGETDVRMREKYGDMTQDGSIVEEALKAVHNDETGKLLRAELKAINNMQNKVKEFTRGGTREKQQQTRQGREAFKKSIPPLKWFEVMARDVIEGKSIREIKPGTYARAAAKAAREAEDALGKQDFVKASEAKQRQLTNHYLYSEAVKAQELVEDKIVPYLKKLGSKSRMGEIGKAGDEYLEQVQSILGRYELTKLPYSALDSRRSLQEYLDMYKDEYDREIPVDSRIKNETKKANYREVPLNELYAVHDAVKAIEHAAKAVREVQKEGKAIAAETARDELQERLFTSHPTVNSITTDPQLLNGFQKALLRAKELNADMTRPEFLIERLDGGPQGPWHDYFWNRYLDSEIKKNELLDLVHEPLKKLVDDMPKEQQDRLASRVPVYIKSMNESFSRQRLFSILMNLGNESNRDKLMRGGIMQGENNREFSQEAIDEIMDHFTKADFDLARGLWDTLGKLLPEAKALHKRWTGLELKIIEPTVLQTKYGNIEGGYWPVKFDRRGSEAGEKQNMESTIQGVQDIFGFSTGSPLTSKGYTHERTNAAYPMMLDWKHIATSHINSVATDIAYREFVSDAYKLLKHPDIKRQMQVRAGEFSNDTMNKWLRGMVGATQWGDHLAADKIYQAAYSHFTTAVLGLNIAGAFADIAAQQTGAFTRVGAKNMMSAYVEFAKNPKQFADFVEEKSEWRHHAEKQIDQSIKNSLDYLAANPGKWNNAMRMALSMRVWMYKTTGNIAWTAKYNEGMDSGLSEKAAIRQADKVQRMTEHSGDIGSISAMERHPLWKKLLVYAGPMEVAYNSMMNNLIEIKDKKGLAPEAWGKFFTMWMAQSVIWAAVRGKKDNDESWAGFIARHAALGPLEAFPILRDLVPYAEKKMLGKHAETRGLAITSQFAATVDAAMSIYKAATGEGETGKAVKDVNIAAGMMAGYPSVQLDITGQYLYDVLTGKYSPKHVWSPITDALYRRKKE